jgi:hypothetical protein
LGIVLRRIFGHKRDDILGELRIPHCSGDKIERNEMDGECRAVWGGERRIQVFG